MNTILEANGIVLTAYDGTSPYLEGVAQVYFATWPNDLDKIRAAIARYTTYPDFLGYVALDQDKVVGMGFGHRSCVGDWWHDRVAAKIGQEHPALQDAWVIVELAVLKEYRGKGVGKALLQRLQEKQSCPRMLLSTEVKNTHARRFYEDMGWTYVLTDFQFSENDEPYTVMCRTKN